MEWIVVLAGPQESLLSGLDAATDLRPVLNCHPERSEIIRAFANDLA
jgi:hypothetical protein